MSAMMNIDECARRVLPAAAVGERRGLRRIALGALRRAALVGLLCLAVGLARTPAVAATLTESTAGQLAYVVRKGDTLSGIGRRHGLPVARLKSLNGLRSDLLKPGQRLVLEPPRQSALSLDVPEVAGLWRVIESFLDTPYRFGGNDERGIDCSAFVQQVFRHLDIDLPRSARDQYGYGEDVDLAALRSGDLLFFRTYARYPSHVGIYLGEGRMAHASTTNRRVVTSDIGAAYFRKRFLGARRLAVFVDETIDFTAREPVAEEFPEEELDPADAEWLLFAEPAGTGD